MSDTTSLNIFQKIKASVGSFPLLVVDDEAINRKLVGSFLESAGFQKIDFALSGDEALARIAIAPPACVILAINMPDMGGYEVLRHLRSNVETEDLPVLVITETDTREERNQIMRAGASNLISKPIEGKFLIEQVTDLVEHKQLIDRLSHFHDRLSPELALAAEMQRNLMPTDADIKMLERTYGVRLASHFQPSSELGGDFWTLQLLDEDRFGLMSVDFSGHGISAALNTFRLHLLIGRMDAPVVSPATYLQAINSELSKVMSTGQYCTVLYAIVDVTKNTVTYSGAAAPPPLVGCQNNEDVTVGDGSGLPLGIRASTKYVDHVVDFEENSFLFLFSDALYETDRGSQGRLDIDDIARLAGARCSPCAKESLDSVLDQFYEGAPTPLPDDLTAIWLSR